MNDETLALTKQEAVKRHVLGLKQMSGAGTSTKLQIAEIIIGERLAMPMASNLPATSIETASYSAHGRSGSSGLPERGWPVRINSVASVSHRSSVIRERTVASRSVAEAVAVIGSACEVCRSHPRGFDRRLDRYCMSRASPRRSRAIADLFDISEAYATSAERKFLRWNAV